MNQSRVLFWMVLAFMFSVGLHAQEYPFASTAPEEVGMSSDSLENMDVYFHRLVDENQLAGIQTAVFRKGKLAHLDSYGYANIEEEKPLDEQSVFRIFSMTKPIVSVALMQLYEAGKFRLEDSLYQYIPEFREMQIYTDSMLIKAKNPIRIVDLLRHTSGFSYGRTQYEALNQMYRDAHLHASANNKEFITKLSQLPLSFEPGTDWQYGFSTNICGYLIEVLSGKSLDVYLEEHIFSPLGMHDTHFQLPAEKVERFTVGYGWTEGIGLTISEQQRVNRYTNEVTLFNGGGGLVSTTFDYMKFCQLFLNGGQANGHQVLKKETIELMLKDHLEPVRAYQDRFRLPAGEHGFGLGFAIRGDEDGLDKVYGWGGAVGTYFKIDLDHELAYVMMIQLSPYRHLGLRQRIQDYVEAAIID
ncbi:MAG: beta-lactamase family protein [Mameliella sp.]|nr:beta-lactamase family protein [Phaeodactylibacter sp.]